MISSSRAFDFQHLAATYPLNSYRNISDIASTFCSFLLNKYKYHVLITRSYICLILNPAEDQISIVYYILICET